MQVDWSYVRKLLELGADPHVTFWHSNLAIAIVVNGTPDDWSLLKELPFHAADFRIRRFSSIHPPTILQILATHPSDPVEWLRFVLDCGVDGNDSDIFTDNDSHDDLYDRNGRGPAMFPRPEGLCKYTPRKRG